jgi:predicted alpha/beta-hydrolase family hydrolase
LHPTPGYSGTLDLIDAVHQTRRGVSQPLRNDGLVTESIPVGLILAPGASARRDHPALLAIDRAVTDAGVVVERIEFPGQAAGKRRPDPPELCIQTIRTADAEMAARLDVAPNRIALGGRSMGGRMCAMAVAEGLASAALVLVSYPLHPPGRPDRLRTDHFPELRLPCLFVSGRRDAFGTPGELESETAAIPGPVTLVFVDGDHSLRRREAEVADIVTSWLTNLT